LSCIRITTILSALAAATIASAGSLTPPGTPAPTMKPLNEIEPRTAIQSLPSQNEALHVITAPGSYYLTGNITAAEGLSGILVSASGVRIDLNGFSIIGPGRTGTAVGSFSGILIPTGFSRITIRNGQISNFPAAGVSVFTGSSIVSISDLVIADCGTAGIAAGSATDVTIRRVQATGIYSSNSSNKSIFAVGANSLVDSVLASGGAGSNTGLYFGSTGKMVDWGLPSSL
jgi:hypothetical protein